MVHLCRPALVLLVGAFGLLGPGCAHVIQPNPHVTVAVEPRLPVRARYYIAPEDRERAVVESFFALGQRNTWRIEVGQALARALPLQLEAIFAAVHPASTPDDLGDADVLVWARVSRFGVGANTFCSGVELSVRVVDAARRTLLEERFLGAPLEGTSEAVAYFGYSGGEWALQRSAEYAFEEALPKLAWRLGQLWSVRSPGAAGQPLLAPSAPTPAAPQAAPPAGPQARR